MAQIRDIFRLKEERSHPERQPKNEKTTKGRPIRPIEQPLVPSGIELTAEQLKIVGLPPDARALVTAGPGTGKTHVLVARLRELVNRHGLQPGRELLVLSFSRAAVGEIRRRVIAAGGDVRYTRTHTFDSFATRLLSQIDPDGSWVGEGYNGRINRAIELIRNNPDAKAIIRGYAHILVDEIQDLVGERASFVGSILDASSGGFTLLGDPAQGVYNFQLPKQMQQPSGPQLLFSVLRIHYSQSIRSFTLTKNHRTQTEIARSAVSTGIKLNQPNPDYDVIAVKLKSIIEKLPRLKNPEIELPNLMSDRLTTAILCRTHAQALVISRDLSRAGIKHVYQRSATDRTVPPWIGIVFGSWEYGQIGKGAFREHLLNKLGNKGPDPDEAWVLLKRIEGQTGNTLDITTISNRIATGNIPDELNHINSGMLTVSTIHRAKGLEFDRVIIVEPYQGGDSDDIEIADEARLLYVALTRPRRELLRMAAPDTWSMLILGYDKRWAKRYDGWKLISMEIKGQDIHSQDPVGAYLLNSYSAPEIQEYLQHEVKVGDPVELRQISAAGSGQSRVFYSIQHNQIPIGITSERFSDILHSIIKVNDSWDVRWPTGFTDVRVEAIDTVAGTVAAGQSAGLNGTGLWLRTRVSGLGILKWR